jgi:hypothetical protein
VLADLGAAALLLGWPGGIVVTRATGAFATATGRWVTAGGTTTLTIAAMVDPNPGKSIAMLPEGERGEEAILVITAVPLRASNSETGAEADIIAWNGGRWRVGGTRDYVPLTGHCEAVCTRLDED